MLETKVDAATLLDPSDWSDFHRAVFVGNEKPDIVAAIARKMPRLLEYLGYLDNPTCPVVTERALPWISDAQLRTADAKTYADLYGPMWRRALQRTGLSDLFRSWWFPALVGWLTASMLLCSIVHLPALLRSLRSQGLLLEPAE